MSIILTKYGNTVAITTTTNKVLYMSVKQFLNAFTLNKVGPEGPENMQNGNFTGAATNWTLGAGWVYGTDKVSHTSGMGTAALQQTGVLVLGQRYVVRFTVTGSVGTVTVTVGGVDTVVNAGAGAVKLYVVVTNVDAFRIRFTPTDDFNGAIDAVSVRKKSYLISLDTDRVDEVNIDISAWTIAGNSGLTEIDEVGAAIQALVQYDSGNLV